jgi:hypothetical protein
MDLSDGDRDKGRRRGRNKEMIENGKRNDIRWIIGGMRNSSLQEFR